MEACFKVEIGQTDAPDIIGTLYSQVDPLQRKVLLRLAKALLFVERDG